MALIKKLLLAVFLLVILYGCTYQEEKSKVGMERQQLEDADGLEVSAISSDAGELLAGTTTPYLEFSKEHYDKAISENKIILLYFYASWCPICKREQPEIYGAFDAMDYGNVIGFRVNYRDSYVDEFEEELAREHGITYQHTKVIIKDGKEVLKAPDSWNKDRYIEEIRKVL